MNIQRQMRAVDRQIVVQQEPEQLVTFSRPRMCLAPKQTMMNDEQIRFRLDRHPRRDKAGIDRGSHPAHSPSVLHLESVHRARPIVEFGWTKQFIATPLHRIERHASHKPSKAKTCIRGQAAFHSARHSPVGLNKADRTGASERVAHLRQSVDPEQT